MFQNKKKWRLVHTSQPRQVRKIKNNFLFDEICESGPSSVVNILSKCRLYVDSGLRKN